jgi:hypothetical protein
MPRQSIVAAKDRIPSPEAYAIVRSASCRSGAGRWRCLRASYPRRPQAPPSARTELAAGRKGSIRWRLGCEARGYCPSSNAIRAHCDASRLPGCSCRHLRQASAYTRRIDKKHHDAEYQLHSRRERGGVDQRDQIVLDEAPLIPCRSRGAPQRIFQRSQGTHGSGELGECAPMPRPEDEPPSRSGDAAPAIRPQGRTR